jgi:RimK family alpha-L-glutamate ligase
MKILIVGLKRNPQFFRIKVEGEKRGHEVSGCFASELVIKCDKESFTPTLRDKEIDHDLIYLWAVGKRRWEWYTAALFLKKNRYTTIVNEKVIDPTYNYYLTPALDYLKQTENTLNYPKSAVLFSPKSIDSAVEGFSFPLICKISGGRQGRGVFKVNSKEEIVKVIKEWKDRSPSFVIREFIPNDGDIRIFTVGYQAIGAMKRTAVDPNEFRSNISLGGKGEKFDFESYPEVKSIAEKLSEVTRTEIAGVDIMLHKETGNPYILEINPGPQFTGFEKYTGVNAAEKIVEYFEELYNKKQRKS